MPAHTYAQPPVNRPCTRRLPNRQQGGEYDQAREEFLANDDSVDMAAAALKPHTLAEVSGAVPEMPPCYVARPSAASRLAEALSPDEGKGGSGATSVVYDSVANGKR